MPRRPLFLFALAGLFTSCVTQEEPLEELPERNVSLQVSPTSDAAEGARARHEEGKVGRKDAKMDHAKPWDGPRTAQPAIQIARGSGVLGALKDDGVGLGDAGLSGGAGGLIGAQGTQIGSGGLGSRGAGLGGGGTAIGLGGIGTRGIGSGKSGYGSGSGSFGSAAIAPPPRAVGSEHYTDYGVNGYTLTEADAQSTFSIDVDTASFAVARSYLDRHTLPPQSAVRVEEFVNAQRYSYPGPDGEAPFTASLEAAPDPFRSGHHLVRIGVKAKEAPVDRDPVHLTFLVDVSGSMSAQNKLPLAQRSLHYLVDHLQPEDRVALVTYAGHTGVVLQPTRVANASAIHTAIDGLRNGGGTAMDSGMHLAYDLALQTLEPGTENRVIVLSDGDANIGRSSHEQILEGLRGYAKKGITLSTIGFGRGNYQDTLMEQLANEGDGNYYYIDAFAEAQKVFGRDLAGTVQTVARDVKLQVDFDPETVLSYRLIGYENRDIADQDFRNDAVDAGEIGSGHTVTALYDVLLRDAPSETLATLRIRSKPPGPDAPAVERSTPLPTAAVRTELADASPDFRIAYAAATFAELLRGSPHAEEITYDQVATLARRARRNTDDDALVRLIERAGSIAHPETLAGR